MQYLLFFPGVTLLNYNLGTVSGNGSERADKFSICMIFICKKVLISMLADVSWDVYFEL